MGKVHKVHERRWWYEAEKPWHRNSYNTNTHTSFKVLNTTTTTAY
jgi:hypothetical protein